VTSELQRLGRDAVGAIEIPNEWQVAGWYAEGVRPGQVGPAVIVGHVDSRQGPAVFYRLREMRRGDKIKITRRDGSVVTFVVDRLEQHAKTRFPTDDVYLPTLEPALRLVTCDGTFDRSTGHYRDNLVVFAHLRG
jgi:sortase (surface protein transpeptidase)